MNYKLAKELKEAGFPQKQHKLNCYDNGCYEVMGEACVPTLEELIEACGDRFYGLFKHPNGWGVWETDSDDENNEMFEGSTPLEAVARLWMALNSKQRGTI